MSSDPRYIITYLDGGQRIIDLRLTRGGRLGLTADEAILGAKALAMKCFQEVEVWKWAGEMSKDS